MSRWGTGSFRLGITDRLEWTDLLQLRYALLDDRPADGRAPQPLSLALRAGFYGIGYSSTLGMIAYPTAAVETLKRLGNQWAFGLSLSWIATWSQREGPALRDPDDLGYRAGLRRSYWSLEGFAARQLTERFALTFSPWFRHTGACLSAACDWVMQSTGALLHLQFRPRYWLTLRAGPYARWHHRPSAIPSDPDPLAPVSTPPPSSGTWLGLSARVAIHW